MQRSLYREVGTGEPVGPEVQPPLPETLLPLDLILPALVPEDAGEEQHLIQFGWDIA